MPEQHQNAKSIFWQALELNSPRDRELFLDAECGDDASLRARVEQLLAAGRRSDSFLDPPVATKQDLFPDLLDSVIGPYRIREQIGEGGMGVVYVAEQTQTGAAQGRAQNHQTGHGHEGSHRSI